MFGRNKEERPESRTVFIIRTILNIIFMVLAVIGVVMYLKYDEIKGEIMILISVAFKMAECSLRLFKIK